VKKKAQPKIDAFSWDDFQTDPPFFSRFLITSEQSKIQTGRQENSQAIGVTHQAQPKFSGQDLDVMLKIFLKLLSSDQKPPLKDEFN